MEGDGDNRIGGKRNLVCMPSSLLMSSLLNVSSADEFVAKRKSWHEPSFLKPEDCREGSREENTFHSCECYEPFGE